MSDEAESESPPLTASGSAAERDARDCVRPERVVEEHADLVYSLARRLARDEEEAGELFQESFVRILRGLPAFEGRASLRTWICQVVINCDRNRRRWWSRFRRNIPAAPPASTGGDEEDAAAPDPADCAAGPERAAIGREIRERVDAGLRALPTEQRIAVILRDVEGLSYEEIAAAMEITLGTVKSKISRARAALRQNLADLVESPKAEILR